MTNIVWFLNVAWVGKLTFHNNCEMCGEWFSVPSMLTYHKVSVHIGLYFLCKMCDELFDV